MKDNEHTWELWDAFGIEHATMFGWWNQSAPVVTGSNEVLATSYVRKGLETLVAVATWAKGDASIELKIDLEALGFGKSSDTGSNGEDEGAVVEVVAPAIQSFNRAKDEIKFPVGKGGVVKLDVPAYQGWLLLVRRNKTAAL